MGKARGDEQLLAVLEAQFDPEPLAIAGRAASDVDGHVKERPPPAAHQLGLRARRALEMQAPQRAHLRGQGMVVLYEIRGDAMGAKFFPAPGFGEKPAKVAKAYRRDHQQARKSSTIYFHLKLKAPKIPLLRKPYIM